MWSPVHVTPIVMVFLSELVSEIRDMDHSLKRELFEAYNTMGANNADDNLADEDAFADDKKRYDTSLSNESENCSKSTVMIRISNLEFDIGCAPVTEETVKIIFNKPVDIVLSTDTVETGNNGENISLLSCNTISVPDLQVRLQESYMTSSNEISLKDLRIQSNILTPMERAHPPVRHTLIDLASGVDIFSGVSSINSLYTFGTAWGEILQNAQRDMNRETRMFWGQGITSNDNASAGLKVPLSNSVRKNGKRGVQLLPDSPAEFLCFKCKRLKVKLRNVPLQNLELIEVSLVYVIYLSVE